MLETIAYLLLAWFVISVAWTGMSFIKDPAGEEPGKWYDWILWLPSLILGKLLLGFRNK